MKPDWLFMAACWLAVFVVGWALHPADKFGYILGVILISLIYLLAEQRGRYINND